MKAKTKPRKAKEPKKVHKVMHEFKEHTLKSSSGAVVTDPKMAKAIAMSESGMSRKRRKRSN